MDTPYRLKKTLNQFKDYQPQCHFVLGMDLTKPQEKILTGNIDQILKNYDGEKKEFLLLIY